MSLADLPPQDSVFSVSEVTRHLRHVLESNLPAFFVEGEVANLTRHRSGHWYFSLKDADATLRCVFFRQWNRLCAHRPQEGDKVVCGGRVTVYEKGGSYQLSVERLLPSGVGDLQRRFEALKRKLDDEGLFAPERKKSLPVYPEHIGVITSPTGAAWQDIRNVLSRRWPCRVMLAPARVQGDNAPRELTNALERLDAQQPDVIIIGRGGGSQEDLFVFNDEQLVRAVANCVTPVVSAVGHEIDFSLCDFAADLRAPTPSAAAELAVPDRNEVMTLLRAQHGRAVMAMQSLMHEHSHTLDRFDRRLIDQHPRRLTQGYQKRLDKASWRLRRQIEGTAALRVRLNTLGERLTARARGRLLRQAADIRLRLTQHTARMRSATAQALSSRRAGLDLLRRELDDLSPRQAMRRGYAVICRERKLIRSVNDLQKGETVDIHLHDGIAECEITDTRTL